MNEAELAENQLMHRTIPYQDRVLVKLQVDEGTVSAGGIHRTAPISTKYSNEAVEGTCIRSGGRVKFVRPGDRVWLDKRMWNPNARYVIVKEPEILAYEPPVPNPPYSD